MRKPLPPYPVLSADGRYLAVANRQRIEVIENASGQHVTWNIAHPCQVVAWSPTGHYLAAAGDDQLSLLEMGSELTSQPKIHFVVRTPARITRLRVGDHPSVVGVTAFSEKNSTLCIWSGLPGKPLFQNAGVLLPTIVPEGLALIEDSENQGRVLVWGTFPTGIPYGNFYQFDQQKIEPSYPLDAAIFEDFNGLVFLYGIEEMLVYSREVLQILQIGEQAHLTPKVTYPLGNLETVVVSTNNQYAVSYWAEWDPIQEQDSYPIRVTSLMDGSTFQEGRLKEVGRYTQVVVDHNGQVTLAYSIPPNQICILQLKNGIWIAEHHLTLNFLA